MGVKSPLSFATGKPLNTSSNRTVCGDGKFFICSAVDRKCSHKLPMAFDHLKCGHCNRRTGFSILFDFHSFLFE